MMPKSNKNLFNNNNNNNSAKVANNVYNGYNLNEGDEDENVFNGNHTGATTEGYNHSNYNNDVDVEDDDDDEDDDNNNDIDVEENDIQANINTNCLNDISNNEQNEEEMHDLGDYYAQNSDNNNNVNGQKYQYNNYNYDDYIVDEDDEEECSYNNTVSDGAAAAAPLPSGRLYKLSSNQQFLKDFYSYYHKDIPSILSSNVNEPNINDSNKAGTFCSTLSTTLNHKPYSAIASSIHTSEIPPIQFSNNYPNYLKKAQNQAKFRDIRLYDNKIAHSTILDSISSNTNNTNCICNGSESQILTYPAPFNTKRPLNSNTINLQSLTLPNNLNTIPSSVSSLSSSASSSSSSSTSSNFQPTEATSSTLTAASLPIATTTTANTVTISSTINSAPITTATVASNTFRPTKPSQSLPPTSSMTSSNSSSTNQFYFRDVNNAIRILEGLNRLRQLSGLCDIILKVDGEEFNCHKCVLSSLSNYFKAMFSCELAESKQSYVSIHDIDACTMKLIIDYAYTSQINIHENNVQALLTAANLFDIKSIKDACCRYMEWQMDASNCIGIHCFSETHDCLELKQTSFNYILANFCKVILHDEFLTIQKSKLIELISDDNLNVPHEDIVFNACIRWLDYASETRTNDFYNVLEHIRLPLLSAYFLYDKVQSEQRLKCCDKSRELIQEALMYNLLKDRRNQVQNERTRSRKSFTHLEALVVVGGEDDRVILRSVEAYFPSLEHWITLKCAPHALSKHCIVAGGENMLYLAGGESADATPTDTFYVYNILGLDEWKQLANLQTPRAEFGMAIVDGCVYAVGGNDGEKRLSSIERYDPLLNAWKYCAQMKIAISSPAVCSLNGLLYVTGGTIDDYDLVDLILCYNPASDTWKELATMPIPRTGCVSCALNGLIYVIGGMSSLTECSNRVDYYDPSLDKWFTCKSMIENRSKPAAAVLNNRIYVCGGEEAFNLYHDSIECYDSAVNEWHTVAVMTSGRSYLSCATLRLQNPLLENHNLSNVNNLTTNNNLSTTSNVYKYASNYDDFVALELNNERFDD